MATVVTGTFTAAAQSSPATALYGAFNITLWGTFSATVLAQRSLDNGTTWVTVSTDGTGSLASYTSPISVTA